MKQKTKFSLILCNVMLGTQLVFAGPLPKEGAMNLLSCWSGDAPPAMVFSKEHLLGTLAWTGVLWNPTAGSAFDAMSGECGGHYTVSPAGVDAVGQCQFADGDKMLVSIPKNHNGSGTWTFVAGTGKYSGISGGGEFKPMRQFAPAITQGKAVVCNIVTGTYKLP